MISWSELTDKVEAALGAIQVPTFLGTPIGTITPQLAAQVAIATVREDVEAHIRSIPTVPTNRNDVIITLGGFALLAGAVGGFGYLMYKLDKNDGYMPAPAKPAEKTSAE